MTKLIDIKTSDAKSRTTDVQLLTEFDNDHELRTHAQAHIVNRVLNMTPKQFENADILGELIETVQREKISMKRKGRMETIEVSRQPDNQFIDGSSIAQGGGFLKRFFSPKRKIQ